MNYRSLPTSAKPNNLTFCYLANNQWTPITSIVDIPNLQVTSQVGNLHHTFALLENINSNKLCLELNAYPNPARKTITLETKLSEPSSFTLEIFTVMGGRVYLNHQKFSTEKIIDNYLYQFNWNLTNNDGRLLANGVYLLKLSATSVVDGSYCELIRWISVTR
jgi:hypothetical protein